MRTLGAATLLLVLATSACGGDVDGDDPVSASPSDSPSESSSESPASEATPTSTVPTEPPSSGATAEGFTAPGSLLTLGQTATVPLQELEDPPTGTADITVTSIREISQPDLEAAGADTGDQVAWAFDVTLVVTQVSDDFGPLQASVDLVGASGGRALSKLTTGTDVDCAPADLGSSTAVGDTVEFCVSALADPGQVVDAAWTHYKTDWSFDGGQPITWRDSVG